MSGARHRRKGTRLEREIVARHKALGVHAERYPLSGSSQFRGSGHDVDIYALSENEAPLVAEVKGRANTSTKYDAIALIAQSDDTEDWPGVKIVLEAGKASFQGKLVDSISVRAPRTAPIRPAAAAVAEPDFTDEI